MHVAQRDRSSQPLLKLRLNRSAIFVDIEGRRKDQQGSDNQNDEGADHDRNFTHDLLPQLTGRLLNEMRIGGLRFGRRKNRKK